MDVVIITHRGPEEWQEARYQTNTPASLCMSNPGALLEIRRKPEIRPHED